MTTLMDDLLAQDDVGIFTFNYGQSIKGKVIDFSPSRILLDLPGGNTGIITKKEMNRYDTDEELQKDSEIESVVLTPENEEGLVVLSLRRASIDTTWSELSQLYSDGRIFKIKIDEANKGGLIGHYKGLKAFLPVSQLTPLNYPRVPDGSGSAILSRLEEHVGKVFAVRLINVDREGGKVIISEKSAHDEQIEQTISNIKISDSIKGIVSGVMKFGIFVTHEGVEGLVHLSELDWAHVSDPSKHYSIGDKVEVLVIGKDGEKLSFSIKRLTEDPWLKKAEPYSVGITITGKVVRWNQNGVFVEIEPEVQGLFSLDQFAVERHSELKITEGESMSGEITEINYNSHRLELKLPEDQTKKTETTNE